jgi:transposase
MNVHQNARLTPHSRAELVRRVVVEGQTPKAVAAAFGVTVKTVRKWVARFQTEGVEGLHDRSSRPHHLHRPTPAATVVTIEALRRQRWTGQQIAAAVGVSPATISRILRRLGLSRIQALEPAAPVRRYEREHPGELIHIDIKKLGRFDRVGHRMTGDRTRQSKGRGVGWEFVHVCIDDASRVAFSQILPDEKKESAVAFLRATVAYYVNLSVTIARVMTDNGSCYRSKVFRQACRDLGLKHIRTKPYTPKTKRQGRALHPDRPARMGLRSGVSNLGPPRCSVADLAAPIQLAPAAQQSKIKTAHQPPRSDRGQPVEAPHLEHVRIKPAPENSAASRR